MEMTEPIKDKKQIELVKTYLRSKSSKRDYVLFYTGISSALRISDLLRLTIGDVWDGKRVRGFIEVREKKTGKYKRFPIGRNLEKAIVEYIKAERKGAEQTDPLFISTKQPDKPISRQYAARMLNDTMDFCGINIRYGTHGLRKTWAYNAFRQTGNLEMISMVLNHGSLAETRRYICIQQDELDDFYLSVDI